MESIINGLVRCFEYSFNVFGFTLSFKTVFIGSCLISMLGYLISRILDRGD